MLLVYIITNISMHSYLHKVVIYMESENMLYKRQNGLILKVGVPYTSVA